MAPGSSPIEFPGRASDKNCFHDHQHEIQQEAAAVAVGREADVVVAMLLTIGAFQHPHAEFIRNPVKSLDWQHRLHWQPWLHRRRADGAVRWSAATLDPGTFRQGYGTAAQYRVIRDHA